MDNIIKSISEADLKYIIEMIKDVFTIISISIASIVAILGLKTWRKQLRGKTEYDLARNLLTGIYKIRDEIKYVRNPFMSAGEKASALQKQNIEMDFNDPKFSGTSSRAVWFTRMEKLLEAYNSLNIYRLEAEAIWGSEIEDLMKQLDSQIATLQNAIDLYTRDTINNKTNHPLISTYEEIVYFAENDPYSTKLQDIIDSLESEIKPWLEI